MKRKFSLGSSLLVVVAGGSGAVVFLSYLVPGLDMIQKALIDWAVIIGTMSLVFLGGLNVLAVHWGKMAASAVVGMVPSVILASFFLRYLVKGLTMGALKD